MYRIHPLELIDYVGFKRVEFKGVEFSKRNRKLIKAYRVTYTVYISHKLKLKRYIKIIFYFISSFPSISVRSILGENIQLQLCDCLKCHEKYNNAF